jgi:hypothetical protein
MPSLDPSWSAALWLYNHFPSGAAFVGCWFRWVQWPLDWGLLLQSQSQSHISTDSQSVCLGVEPRLGLMTSATAAYMHPDIAHLDAMPRPLGTWCTKWLLATLLQICAATLTVELNYNVMAHAQKTVFVYGCNGRVHILLQQEKFSPELEWRVTDSLRCHVCPWFPILGVDVCRHIVIEL